MRTLLFAIFIDFVGFGLLLPLLPFYAMNYGASVFQITLLISLHPAMSAIASPILGRLSDRFGRKPILVASLAIGAVSFLWFAMAPDLLQLFLARAVLGCSAGSAMIAQAYIADITTESQRATGMSRISAAISLGFVAGPVLGGILSQDGTEFLIPCLAAAAAAGCAALLCLSLPHSNKPRRPTEVDGPQPQSAWAQITRPDIAIILALIMMITYVFTQFIAIMPMWLFDKFHWGAVNVGFVIALTGIIYAVVQGVLLGPACKRFGEIRVLTIGTLSTAATLVLLTFASSPVLFIILVGLVCIATATFHPSLYTLLSLRTDPATQGAVMGVAGSFASLIRVIAPPIAGFIFEWANSDWPMRIAAVMILASLILLVFLRRALRLRQ